MKDEDQMHGIANTEIQLPLLLRVLILEDVPRDADLATRELDRGGIACKVRVVCSREEMIRELDNFAPDIILSDFAMPQFTGMQALKIRNKRAPDLPFIVVTASINEETAVECIKCGADDYVTKEHLLGLPHAVKNALEKKRLEVAERVAQEQIRRSAWQWRATFDALNDPVMLLDVDQRIQRCNTAFRDLIGKPWEKIVTKHCCRLLHQKDNSPAECPVLRLKKSRKRETWQTIIGDRWYNITADPMMDDDGRLIGVVHALVDITERIRAKRRQALHATVLSILNRPNKWEALVRDLLKEIKAYTGLDVVAIRLRNGEDFPYFLQNGFTDEFVHEENSLLSVKTGHIERDMAGLPLLEGTCGLVLSGSFPDDDPRFTSNGSFWCNDTRSLLNYPNDRDPRHRPRNRCVKEGYRSMALIPLRSGEEIIGLLQLNDRRSDQFSLDLVRFFEDIGNSIGVAFTRMQTHQALAASEHRFRTLFDGATEGILVTDMESRAFKYANPAICRMLNYSREELLQLKVANIHPKDAMPEIEEGFEGYARGENRAPMILQCLRKDGTKIYVDIRSTRTDIDGRPCLLSFFSDVTERTRLETEKKALEMQLQQAQKMEALGQLAGGVAHDYNNMIGIILGYGDLVLNKLAQDDPLYQNIQEIVSAATRSRDITQQLLAFARQQRVSPRVIDLNETVDGMLKMLRRVLGEEIRLVLQPGHDLWLVHMDPSQLVQILTNLCGNARDAITDVGKITITLENKTLNEVRQNRDADFLPGEYVVLSVSDDGGGMDRLTMKKIFDPFFTTKEIGKGTGLGLSTVYGIVKQNHGFINVQSQIGKGTTFRIYLPRFTGNVEVDAEKRAAQLPRSKGETVLVVEDEVQYLELIETLLTQLGYTVLMATAPSEALHRAKRYRGKINLLITDVVMPEMNGKELGERLQSFYPDLKILYISGYTPDTVAARGINEESDFFIRKPFLLSDLALKIRKVMPEI